MSMEDYDTTMTEHDQNNLGAHLPQNSVPIVVY